MSYQSLNTTFKGRRYRYNALFGWLIGCKKRPKAYVCLNAKTSGQLEYVDNPYLIPVGNLPQKDVTYGYLIRRYALLLIWLHSHFYIGLWILSHFRFPIFDNAVVSCDVFCDIHPQNQHLLCLPRSVFAATTSKSFRKCGIMVIGAFLPSRRMHAWIMENGRNAWRRDVNWINYTPIAVMS